LRSHPGIDQGARDLDAVLDHAAVTAPELTVGAGLGQLLMVDLEAVVGVTISS